MGIIEPCIRLAAAFQKVEILTFTGKQIHALQQRGIRCPVYGEAQFLSERPLTVNEPKTAMNREYNFITPF
jgi:hypothetical protein